METTDPKVTELTAACARFCHGASDADARACIARIYGWTPTALAALIEDMAASTGVKPASLTWWLYATIDMMRTHENRQLVLLAGRAATIMGTVALPDAPPDGSETTH